MGLWFINFFICECPQPMFQKLLVETRNTFSIIFYVRSIFIVLFRVSSIAVVREIASCSFTYFSRKFIMIGSHNYDLFCHKKFPLSFMKEIFPTSFLLKTLFEVQSIYCTTVSIFFVVPQRTEIEWQMKNKSYMNLPLPSFN